MRRLYGRGSAVCGSFAALILGCGAQPGSEPSQASAAACTRARSALEAPLLAAQRCSNAMGAEPCTGRAEDACGCPVPINTPLLPAARAALDGAHATALTACADACAGVRCQAWTSALCQTEGFAAVGVCAAAP